MYYAVFDIHMAHQIQFYPGWYFAALITGDRMGHTTDSSTSIIDYFRYKM